MTLKFGLKIPRYSDCFNIIIVTFLMEQVRKILTNILNTLFKQAPVMDFLMHRID